MAEPAIKSSLAPNFEKQIQRQIQNAATEGQGLPQTNWAGAQWNMPELGEWNGDLFDLEGMSKPFDRSKPNDDYSESIRDGQAPGVVGDGVICTTQVDYLATMERAFRSRHTMRRPRALAHAMSRRRGHGDAEGTFGQCVLEYLRTLVKQSSTGEGS